MKSILHNEPCDSIRVVHISDLHIFFPDFSLSGLFNIKVLFSQVNSIINPKRKVHKQALNELVNCILDLNPDLIIVSGDITAKGSSKEIIYFKEMISALEEIPMIIIFGNHDLYSLKSDYLYLYDLLGRNHNLSNVFSFVNNRVLSTNIQKGTANWNFIAIDQSMISGKKLTHGCFSKETEKFLSSLLKNNATELNTVLIGHFPIHSLTYRKSLERRESLINLIKRHDKIKLYLHGHTHSFHHIDMRQECGVISIDAGSTGLNTPLPSFACYDLQNDIVHIYNFVYEESWNLSCRMTTSI